MCLNDWLLCAGFELARAGFRERDGDRERERAEEEEDEGRKKRRMV